MDDDRYMRPEAAQYLRISPKTLATWACTKRVNIPYIKIGRSVRYRKSDLDEFLRRNTVVIDTVALSAIQPFPQLPRIFSMSNAGKMAESFHEGSSRQNSGKAGDF
jgi:excisionase family DNA binding protein